MYLANRKIIFISILVISIIAHLVIFSLFKVKISFKKTKPIIPSNITFIGSILPPLITAGQITNNNFEIVKKKSFNKNVIKNIGISVDTEKPEVFVKDKISDFKQIDKENVGIDKNKLIDAISKFSFLHYQRNNLKLLKIDKSFLDNKIKGRSLVYKPDISELKNLVSLYESYGDIVLQIVINPNGRVSYVEIIKTSGNASVDMAMKNYFRKCVFEPLFSDKIQRTELQFNLTNFRRKNL